MKANEFIKKHGLEYAKHILTDDAPLVMDLNYTDLKRLVESHDLIDICGGLDVAKNLDPRFLPNWVESVNQAIADVESCQ